MGQEHFIPLVLFITEKKWLGQTESSQWMVSSHGGQCFPSFSRHSPQRNICRAHLSGWKRKLKVSTSTGPDKWIERWWRAFSSLLSFPVESASCWSRRGRRLPNTNYHNWALGGLDGKRLCLEVTAVGDNWNHPRDSSLIKSVLVLSGIETT